ncbi:transcript variant X2 [Nothobranchius furzeri]|uniref:Transcript variant X2 n=1 Tax=Nothobranchius furzeri TaxID=105023 RepID=A0A9D2Y859_NOTFU|nr:transcript variant X2 [Nothobranchius furzeri]
MSSSKEDGLSPEELRKRLYQTFKNRGVLDTLKVQLRNQLIQELKCSQEPAPRPVPDTDEPLLLLACNSIVSNHLVASGYEYTLSVFYPECGLSKDKILKRDGLLQILKIHPASPHYSSMVNNVTCSTGFLFSLLKHLTNDYHPSLCHDVETQTTSLSSYGESLVEKMKMIDKEYESVSFSDDRIFPFQSKLAAYRKETEAQMEAEMNTKLQHFKEVEIAKVRMEEKSKFHKEFDRLKQELERNYEMKTTVLMEREKNAIDRLQKQQEIEEKNIYLQRQAVLKDIESVHNRENELRRRMEAFEQTCQTQAEKVQTTEELLRRRELAVKTMEDTYDQKLKNELARYQLELKEEFIKRTESLTESENRNKEEAARIQKESAVINATLAEHDKARSELKRRQMELETAEQQISLLTQQNNVLKERLESTGDYLSLKRERAELQGQVELLKQQLEGAQEESRQLRAEIIRPSEAQLALQKELQRLQNARRVDEEDFNNQKQLLQMQLQSEVDRCAQLKAQLLEGEERSQWMTKYIDDVKAQLRQTQQALENEVLRHPKPLLVDRSVLLPHNTRVDRAQPRTGVGSDDVCEAGGPSRGYLPPQVDSPDSDLAEAKARIQELQKEADRVEEAYRSNQQRAAYSTVSQMLPPKPVSLQHWCHSQSPGFPLRKQDSHVLPTHKPKSSLKTVSPQRVQTPSLVSHDAKRLFPPAHLGVTVSEDNALPLKTAFTDLMPHLLAESVLPRDEGSSSRKLREENSEEEIVSPVVFPPPLSDRLLSGAPLCKAGVTGDFPADLSPPHSPQLKSTAREQPSPPSSESSPQPEKINVEDLTGTDSEPGHIPKLLLDTAVPLPEEAPDGPSSPHPQDLPGDPADAHGQAGDAFPEVPQASGHSARTEEEEDGEQKWERERKEREERRQREREEAKERELRELEQLEMLSQQEEQLEGEEETKVKKEEEEQEEESKGENPMEKYMMVLRAEQKQSPVRQESGQTSPEEKSLSEQIEQSVAACSLKDDEDDFW